MQREGGEGLGIIEMHREGGGFIHREEERCMGKGRGRVGRER